jgi:hypothetical protein
MNDRSNDFKAAHASEIARGSAIWDRPALRRLDMADAANNENAIPDGGTGAS